MYTKNIYTIKYIFIYIIFYIQSIYSRNFTIHSNDIPEQAIYRYNNDTAVSKTNINPKNYGKNYYCRGDDCIELQNSITHVPYIEFPDENGNVKLYILESCIYDDKSKELIDCLGGYIIGDYDRVSVKCTKDSECLYNKCIDNHCVFNEDSPIVHCDIIYRFFAFYEKSYVHCGKTYGDKCEKDNECSSKACHDLDKKCGSCIETPSDSVHSIKDMETFFSFTAIIIILMVIYCICCCRSKKHEKNKFEKIQK